MSSLIEHVERAEIARWEAIFNEELPCEGERHPYGDFGHDGGGARICVVFPCCGARIKVCRGRADYLRFTYGAILCNLPGGCGAIRPRQEFAFIEL